MKKFQQKAAKCTYHIFFGGKENPLKPAKKQIFPWNQLFFRTDSLREGAVSAEEPHARKENVQKASLQGSIDWTTRMDSVYSSRYVVEVRAMTTFLLFWRLLISNVVYTLLPNYVLKGSYSDVLRGWVEPKNVIILLWY